MDLRQGLGKGEVWRSLSTDSFVVAKRRAHHALGQIESNFEQLREALRDQAPLTLLKPCSDGRSWTVRPIFEEYPARARHVAAEVKESVPTFGEVYDRFMCDPTQDWSPRTRLAYETTQRLALSIIGAERPMDQLNRAVCRDFLDTLRFLPKGASRAFPDLSPRQAAEKAKQGGYAAVISPSNINTYLNKLCVVLNWAVTEELLNKNHLKGLRVADPVSQRDKRMPFDDAQLESIFSAPLYTGCLDDKGGYARVGDQKPKGTRYWLPLLGLLTGMRLNEICQLDTSDVRKLDDVDCIVVSSGSLCGSTDKRLKTVNSERIVPIHPRLLQLGFLNFVSEAVKDRRSKLFEDINPGPNGIRATYLSKWFIQFLERINAKRPLTSYHSFRHCFRDSLREARVDKEVAMALGGWGNGGKAGLDVSDFYGRGYAPRVLRDELAKVRYDHVRAIRNL